MSVVRILTIALLSSGLLLATAFGGPVEDTDEQVLRYLVRSYWDSQIARDWSRLYDFSSASLKSEITREQFISVNAEKHPLQYISFELGLIEISGDLAWVDVTYSARPSRFSKAVPKTARISEVWKKESGEWHHLQREQAEEEAPILPPSQRRESDENVLRERADRFWDAREHGQWEIVYQLCDPKLREQIPLEEFLKKKSLRSYLSHSVEWVEADGDTGKTKIQYKYRMLDPALSKLDPEEESLIEKWIRLDGVWYREVPGVNPGGGNR